MVVAVAAPGTFHPALVAFQSYNDSISISIIISCEDIRFKLSELSNIGGPSDKQRPQGIAPSPKAPHSYRKCGNWRPERLERPQALAVAIG
jgi:hypothetical protein